jgi:hypothetical protein
MLFGPNLKDFKPFGFVSTISLKNGLQVNFIKLNSSFAK